MFWCRVEVSCREDWWKEWALASYLHRAHKKDSFLLSSSFFSWLILSLYRRILTADNTNPDILFATEFMLIQMTASVAILFLFVPKASIIVIHCTLYPRFSLCRFRAFYVWNRQAYEMSVIFFVVFRNFMQSHFALHVLLVLCWFVLIWLFFVMFALGE